jgi:redox-sensitive bicupin YhaK (pirin superfamily)
MANNKILVEERTRDIGKFLVGRLLPFREKRMVGPFCFIDHMGPTTLPSGEAFDVDQHPHIGLCTLTYLLDGQIEHKDSTGASRVISPGSVNLMISGRGVSHTERTPLSLRDQMPLSIHGYQVWIALPQEMEEIEPSFVHIEEHELPIWTDGTLEIKIVAGSAFGKTAPTPVFSPLFMVDIWAKAEAEIDLKDKIQGEIAFVVVAGLVWDDGEAIGPGQMLISKTENECRIRLEKHTRLLLFGGQPFPEQRYMYWNFVSSSRQRLEKAKLDWKNHLFPKVPGDDSYIPLPE